MSKLITVSFIRLTGNPPNSNTSLNNINIPCTIFAADKDTSRRL
jgi:hypothetical protein